jgi:hypothetical protein
MVVILSIVELRNWLYQAQQPTEQEDPTIPLQTRLSRILNRIQIVEQQAVNVGLWLQEQLDELAQELSWKLMPALAPATIASLRSAGEELETIVAELQNQAIDVPLEARGAYRDLRWGNIALRLYALTWALPVSNAPPEWALLLVLGSQANSTMPPGLKLQIRDSWQLLIECNLTEHPESSYLYAQAIGVLDEQFWSKIDLGNGIVVTFSFVFQS